MSPLALLGLGLFNLGRGHSHLHAQMSSDTPLPKWRAFFVGTVHGLAGSAAVGLLVLATVRDVRVARAYLLTFAVGMLIGMALITTGMAAPLALGAKRSPVFATTLRVATGLLSVGFGLYLAWQIGFVDGLFGVHPAWNPH